MTEFGKGGVALLVGAGDAIGAAVARRFATGGYSVCVARRDAEKSRSVVQEIITSGGIAHAVSTDVRSEEAVQALFAQVEAELGPIEVCLFNAGANVKSSLIETSTKLFSRVWELACYGGFLTGREAARYMVPRGPVVIPKERTLIGPAEAPFNRARSSRNAGRNHLGTPSEIKSECWATSSRIRGRLPPESATGQIFRNFLTKHRLFSALDVAASVLPPNQP